MSHQNRASFSIDAPGRARAFGRLGAVTRWSHVPDPADRREATRKAREAAEAKKAAKRAEDAVYAALSDEGKANYIKSEAATRLARLQVASVEAARKRRMNLAAREPVPVVAFDMSNFDYEAAERFMDGPGRPANDADLKLLNALIDAGFLVPGTFAAFAALKAVS